MIEIKPPKPHENYKKFTIFAGGTIEMGLSEDWQSKLKEELKDYDIILLNPRRDNWDSNWLQRMSDPNFNFQVNWELDGLKKADIIFMYFDPISKSPISLLETGLHAKDEKMIVCCPDGFYRKGNVEIVCFRENIPLFNSFEESLAALKNVLNNILNKV